MYVSWLLTYLIILGDFDGLCLEQVACFGNLVVYSKLTCVQCSQLVRGYCMRYGRYLCVLVAVSTDSGVCSVCWRG